MKISSRNKYILGLLMFVTTLLAFSAHTSFSSDEPKVLTWEELVPKDWNPNSVFDQYDDDEFTAMSDEQYFALRREMQAMLDVAPTVDSLDGQNVKIPGFIVPIEYDEEKIKEFLLVPYFGACTHTPPPPANQIIYGKLSTDFTMNKLYEPVWISGKMKTIRSQNKLGEAGLSQTIDVNTGYTMEVEEVTHYQEEN